MDDLKANAPPYKPLLERADNLLTLMMSIGIRPSENGGMGANMEDLGREAVRAARAMESEVATATTRPTAQTTQRRQTPRQNPRLDEFDEEPLEEYGV